MLSADPERAERHDGLLTSGGRSRGGILALCWVTPTPARRQHAAVSHEQSAADLRVSPKTYISGEDPQPGEKPGAAAAAGATNSQALQHQCESFGFGGAAG